MSNRLFYYAVLHARNEDELKRLFSRGFVAPVRLAASPIHAALAYHTARIAHEEGFARAKRLEVEALLYLLAAKHGAQEAPRLDLRLVASEGPRPCEPVVLVTEDERSCSEACAEAETLDETSVEWLDVPEDLALARTALAMVEVERKRLSREGIV